MDEEKKKPRLQVNMGGLIILIIIALILFKVDIKSKIKSEQFQKNITYIENTIKDFYSGIADKFKSKAGDTFENFTDKQLDKLQSNVTNNLLKTTEEDSDKDN